MSTVQVIVALVALQRLVELIHARRNTAALRAAGAIEVGAGHYPLLVLVHVAWLAALFFLIPADAPIRVPLLGLYVALQAVRVWIIASLGRRWTTRILIVPGMPLVRRGPYRYLRHPNYLVVALEIALLPLVFDAWHIALVFSALNGALLGWRIRVENRALSQAAPAPASPGSPVPPTPPVPRYRTE